MNSSKTKKLSFFSNIKSLISFIAEINPKIFFWLVASIFVTAAAPFPYIILSKRVIDGFINGKNYDKTILIILIMVGSAWLLKALNQFIDTQVEKKVKQLEYEAIMQLFYKMSIIDFPLLDDSDTKDIFGKATKCVMAMNFYQLVLSVRTFFSGIIMLFGVFGVIASVDISLLLVISVVIIVSAFANSKLKKIRYKIDNELWPLDRRMQWFMQFSANTEYAKEIRLNGLQDFIRKKYRALAKQFYQLSDKITNSEGTVKHINLFFTLLQEGIVYFVLGYKIVFQHTLTVGAFTMTYSAIATFKDACVGIIDGVTEVLNRGKYFSNYLEFMGINGTFNSGKLLAPPITREGYKIEFKHVSFKYPNRNDYALKDINITIRPFEKLAIVGENGAGKTTFIKLLCRFYDPDEGEILINGQDIKTIEYSSYQKLLSVVFQDYKLFSFTVKENIVFENLQNLSDDDIMQMAEKFGADHMLTELPQKLETILFRDYDPSGVNLSGGESQKLAILRAVVKNTPIMILDEPTAALDPETEDRIYHNFNKTAFGRTAIYISHRLASTRFCDNIILFKDSMVLEYGSHDDLMTKDGEYKRLFDIQSKYYEKKQDKPED